MRDDGHDKREMSLPPGPHHPNDARDLEPLGSSALQGRGMVYVAVENFTTDLKRSVVRSSFLLLLLLLFFFLFLPTFTFYFISTREHFHRLFVDGTCQRERIPRFFLYITLVYFDGFYGGDENTQFYEIGS